MVGARYYVSECKLGTFEKKDWHATRAQTLASAKRAARKMQRFYGTNLLIATLNVDGSPRVVSFLDVNALDMSDKGRWIDRD